MTPPAMTKPIAVVLIQVLIVCSLGAKLLYDRRTRPQAWFKTERYDPDLPIRGRYLNLQIDVADSRSQEEIAKKFNGEIRTIENQRSKNNYRAAYDFGRECGSIAIRNGSPTAEFEQHQTWDCDNLTFVRWQTQTGTRLRLQEPILFFIPDTVLDPSRLKPGDELWVLATIPRKGPPRPISLGIKRAGETPIKRLDLN